MSIEEDRETGYRTPPADPAEAVERARTVRGWLENPHAFFRAFGPAARSFQRRHRSSRLRVMTFVGAPEDFTKFAPKLVSAYGSERKAGTWAEVVRHVAAEAAMRHPEAFALFHRLGMTPWAVNLDPGAEILDSLRRGRVTLRFADEGGAVRAAQWLLLMTGVKLNEAFVQVDPWTDAEWKIREAEILEKRRREKWISS